MRTRTFAALALAALCQFGYAESLEERVKATDMSNADSVFELAQWCTENKLPTKARAYLNQVIKLDKDHEGARTALGQVKVGERWVAAGAPGAPAKPAEGADGAPGATRQASGTAPTAEQIAWDLSLPKDPEPAATWINQYIDKLSSVGNDSDDMAVAVATMLQDEQIIYAIPRLCKKLTEPGFNDLYGASDIVNELMRKGQIAKAKALLPFMMKASERINDPGDLAAFAFSVGQFKDKRVVPRLLQLLESGNDEVKDGASNGLQMVTLLPHDDITVERVRQWWALNHNVSDQQTYQEQLRSSDPRVAVQAADALYEYRERSIVPVLAKLMRGDDKIVGSQAASLLKRITGNDWSYNPDEPADKRKKRTDEIEKWWKEEQFRFIWIEDRNKPAATAAAAGPAADPAVEWVKKLGSANAADAAGAEANIAGAANKAVPALIAGLDDASPLVRRKCHELLERITKQKIAYDPRAEPEVRTGQVAAWRAWAVQQGIMAGEGGEEVVEEPAAGDAPAK